MEVTSESPLAATRDLHMSGITDLRSRRIGLALSGGAVRGIAHIGVLKVLSEFGIRATVVAGTSVGSIIGAGLASGMSWSDLAKMAHEVFWPGLLYAPQLERFCARYLPTSFEDLDLPFAAIATALPGKTTVTLMQGSLASAISASCAVRVWRRPVALNGVKLKDGGISCVLPSVACREMGAEFIIASDVWELSALLRGVGLAHTSPAAEHVYPSHYMRAVASTDLLIQSAVPITGYVPAGDFVNRLISAGERAARIALESQGNMDVSP
ncbi:MAG TPA: patatin-like phospholipase family protein [Terriglobales bacterium]|nr:patatin-like phospholipase family protein [Terriglobales bacterium]